MNHTQKLKLAKSMISFQERRQGVSVFNSMAWNIRRFAKMVKLQKQNSDVKQVKKAKTSKVVIEKLTCVIPYCKNNGRYYGRRKGVSNKCRKHSWTKVSV